jgi:hypothetical protein
VEDRRDRSTVKCFTCPRERRGDEVGWHFVDVPHTRAYGPPRIFVCPRHYGHFAERERGRWTELDAPILAAAPVLVAGAAQQVARADVSRTLDAADVPVAAPVPAPVAALALITTLVSDS